MYSKLRRLGEASAMYTLPSLHTHLPMVASSGRDTGRQRERLKLPAAEGIFEIFLIAESTLVLLEQLFRLSVYER